MEEFIKFLKERVESYAVLKNEVVSTVVKIVDSKVEAVQRIKETSYNVMVRKGSRFLVSKVYTPEQLREGLGIMDKLPESRIVPKVHELSGERRSVKEDDGILRFMSDTSSVEDFLNSRYQVHGVLSASRFKRELVTSAGFHGNESRTWFQGYMRVRNGQYSGQWAFSSPKYDPEKVKITLNKAEEYASYTERIDLGDGYYDVVLSPMVMANLMMSVSYMASGYSIFTGNSIFANRKPGDMVGSEKFTLMDRPRGEELNSWDFDDEGFPTRDKAIISNGVYETPLLNLEIAEIMGKESTGNAGWIYPRPWTLEVKEGEVSEEGLLSGNVVLLTNNWYTRFQNRADGQFSTVARDAVIVFKGGKPVGTTSRVRIADKLNNIISNVEELSKERYSIAWWDAPLPGVYPYTLIKNVHLSKA
ncbi:MAG: TldD/PmbA family protein [Metallosphaera yellowstonensis]|jgi:Predicted Zn-dependent proteases and their inactivated homologs